MSGIAETFARTSTAGQNKENNSIALEVRDVVKSFSTDTGTINAVDHVSFSVNHGEFVALVGPSGSGKTTMLSILAALLTPTSGQVLIDGQDMALMNEKRRVQLRREKIGFTFQSNNLIPFLSALENVELMLRLNNLPSQMSGGQQQRVAIARALIHAPTVVLADEPTASLDTERAFQVVQTFAALIHENNRAGIMVTHDLRMCQYVDRVLQMRDGKLVRVYADREEILALARGGDH